MSTTPFSPITARNWVRKTKWSVSDSFNIYRQFKTPESWFKHAKLETTYRLRNPQYEKNEKEMLSEVNDCIRDAGYECEWGFITQENQYGVLLPRKVILAITRMCDGLCVYGDNYTPLSGGNTMHDWMNNGLSSEQINDAVENGAKGGWGEGPSTFGNTLPTEILGALQQAEINLVEKNPTNFCYEPMYQWDVPECMHTYWTEEYKLSDDIITLNEERINAMRKFAVLAREKYALDKVESNAKTRFASVLSDYTTRKKILKASVNVLQMTDKPVLNIIFWKRRSQLESLKENEFDLRFIRNIERRKYNERVKSLKTEMKEANMLYLKLYKKLEKLKQPVTAPEV